MRTRDYWSPQHIVTPADVKALAAFLSAFADNPTNGNWPIGGLQLSVEIEQEKREPSE